MSEPATVAHPRPHLEPEPAPLWAYLRSQLRRHWRFALGGLLLNSVSGVAVAFQTLTPKYLVAQPLTR